MYFSQKVLGKTTNTLKNDFDFITTRIIPSPTLEMGPKKNTNPKRSTPSIVLLKSKTQKS